MQLHPAGYRRPAQLPAGPVLVVGAGNSGAEIALDLTTDPIDRRAVHLAGRDVGHIPSLGPWTFHVLQRLGRPGAALARRGLGGHGDPLGRIRPGQLESAGVRRHPRVTGVRDGMPLLADGRTLTAVSGPPASIPTTDGSTWTPSARMACCDTAAASWRTVRGCMQPGCPTSARPPHTCSVVSAPTPGTSLTTCSHEPGAATVP